MLFNLLEGLGMSPVTPSATSRVALTSQDTILKVGFKENSLSVVPMSLMNVATIESFRHVQPLLKSDFPGFLSGGLSQRRHVQYLNHLYAYLEQRSECFSRLSLPGLFEAVGCFFHG